MVDTQYMKSCTEILEIIKYIPREDYNKIPSDIITVLENDKDEKYNFKYNINKTLDEQNVSKQAKIIIALFFRDYWATNSQREKILKMQKEKRQKLDSEKRVIYNPDEIFKINNLKNDLDEKVMTNEEPKFPMNIKKDNFIIRLIYRIKSVFNRRNI